MIKALIHAAGAANFGYALYYDLMFVHLPPHLKGSGNFAAMSAFPGKWKFLTVWNMVLQLVYHSIALLNDVAGTNELNTKRQSWIQKFRDSLFAAWAFPTGIFVSLSFWILYGIDRALVFPKEMDEFYPNWLNHGVHTAPILFLAAELSSVPKIYPSRSVGVLANLFFSISYLLWITWVNSVSGVWAYPILEVLNNVQRAMFMGGSGIIILGFYFLGDSLNKWRWGKADTKTASGKGGKSAGKSKRKNK